MDANGLEGTPDSDEDGQIKMLVATAKSSFNNHYLSEAKAEITVKNDSLYDTWHDASDRKWRSRMDGRMGKANLGFP